MPDRIEEPPPSAAPPPGFVSIAVPVCAAHFCSHFFQFLMPPLFPLLGPAYGVSYAELGLLVAVFYTVSGLAQAPAGFVVDRIGAARVLGSGLLLLAGSFTAMALAPPFPVLLGLMALAGLGNSVFHPADYAILSERVAHKRTGRAFALHTLSGTLGYAAAPVAMLWLSGAAGWQAAILAPAASGAAIGMVVLARGRLLSPSRGTRTTERFRVGDLSPVLTPTVLACFGYFVLSALPTVGVAGFLAPALSFRFGTALEVTAMAIGAQLLGNALGTLPGGWLADRAARHDWIVAGGLATASVLVLGAGSEAVSPSVLMAAFGLAGLAAGLTFPSRDMLIRAAATEGTTGRVFGIVYSGYDFGSALTPLILGGLLDLGATGWIVPLIAAAYLAMAGTAMVAGRPRRPLLRPGASRSP
jgi:MFS family permease